MTLEKNPLLAIQNWLDSEPLEVQQTIAMFVIRHLPRPEGEGLPLDFDATLREWLQARTAIIGRAVIFRALVNFTCLGRFTKEGWAEAAAQITEAREYFRRAGAGENLVNQATRMLEQKPFREAMWLRAARSWERLCAGDLSDAALELFRLRPSMSGSRK